MSIHSLISSYYDNPLLYKVKDNDNHTIYMSEVQSLLGNTYRFIVAVVPLDVFMIGDERPLSSLKWVSFQSRKYPARPYRTGKCNYKLKQGAPFNISFERISMDDEYTVYESKELPNVVITLINDKNNMFDYAKKGTLSIALETFNTIVTLK